MTTTTSCTHGVPGWIDQATPMDPAGAAFSIMVPAS